MSKQTIEDIYPLSPSQQGMLFFSLFSGFEGQVYFDQFVSTVSGRLDTEAWRRAWSRVMERHATLRTQFLWERRDEPLQVVWRDVQLPFQVLDWRALPEPEREERFAAFLREDHDRGFNIGKAPLMRIALVHWADEVYKFVGSFHHLVLDGWSMGIILHEALSQYHALIHGRDLQLPPPRRYRDYIGWVARQDLASAESFWKRLLAGFPGRTSLPLDGTGPGGKVTTGWVTREELVYVSPETTQGLDAFARQHQVTSNTLFQAAWCLLLGRYAASSDVVFGTVVSGRPAGLEGIESMVGMFINALPVRVRIDPGADLIPWLKELQALQVELREYDYCPLELIQGWSGLGRQAALFDSVLVYENYPVNALADGDSSGLTIQQARLMESGSIPLTLFATPQGDRLHLRFNYHWTRLSPAAARRIVTQLVALFEAFVARPQARLGDFTRLTETEREELLALGAGQRAEVPAVAVHRLVEEQAARSPEAAAVEADGCILTYAELEARASRLARHLRRLGVGPESIVGLCAARSFDMVVGMLGVLKAGAAYLPLDPAYPAERLAFLLEDSGARWVLAPSGLAGSLPATAPEIVLLDAEIAPDDGSPLSVVDPLHPAYVIYTSGSTGRPKGVLVSHAALVDSVRSAGEIYGIGSTDRVLQFASISFDTSAEEIYPCLSRGATLVLRSEEMAGSLDRFVRESGELGITVLDLPTAYWHELVAEMIETDLALPSSLRLVILGGEAAQADRLAAWRERVAGVRLVNTYGPTEATIVSTHRELTDGIGSTEVPIGRPLPNARTYVVDHGLELVPVGVEGELLIGGAGLARDYLGRPGLTAERFVPDPFSATPGARLYRSGDLVRLLPEGDLEFRGRTDDQVKVRGFRIELGEIEAALRRHAGVRDAVVVAREDTPAEKRLVAYVVPEGEPAPSASELRTVLENQLPRYMVPSVFVPLAALPLTPSGKVDRRALPAPEVSRADVEADYAAPRNEVQEILAGIWSDLLGVERVGIHDDFFQLGGHSLVVARLASRIRQAFKVELPLVEVFHRPTIAELSEAVQKAERTAVEIPDLPPIRRAPRDQPIPLSFPQERVWFLDQLSPGGNLAYNFQVTIWLRGTLDVAVLNRTLSEIVRRHESLRTRFPTVDGRPVQVIHKPYPVALPLADLRGVPAERLEEESERLVFEATQTPFDLTRLPLIRWQLLRLGDEIWELVQVEHHFVHDGWSFSVLLREIKALYEAFLKGEPSPLPELTVQYADFAVWQREWMAGPAMDRMLGYWKEKLAGSPTLLEVPADRPRPEHPAFAGELSLSHMPPALYEGLRAFGRKNGFTLFMTTLTGFFALLERYTGQEDILLGTSNANRRTREIEGLIGMIVNSLVLRGDMTGDPTVLELLGRIRETSLESYAYQDMPLERLVRELRPERALGRNPLFQVMFGFHDAAVPDLEFGGLKGSFLVRGNRSAKMDMNVIIVPRAEQRVGLASRAADQSAVLHWEYSTELFDAPTIQRMIGHYLTLLRGIVETPKAPLSALPVLSETESHQVVREWSGAPAPASRPDCLHEIFAQWARRTPETVAVVFETERLTYGELDRRANQLAHRLLSWRIGRGSRVGLCLERSLDLVVGILGILKAGAAYVPLDPAYPQERLGFLVEDSGAEALVTEERLRTHLPPGLQERGRILCLDSDREEIERQSAEPPAAGATAGDMAYVIYTSGSTGRPKGVAIPHANVAALFAATADRFRFEARDVWTLFHSFAFDFSVWELWGALLHGGRLVVVPYWVSRSPQAFYELLDQERVTVLNQTPSAFRQLAWAEEEAGAAGQRDLALRWVVFGGEALDPGSLRPWFERHGEERPRLVNMYGITETTVHVTYREIGMRDLGAGSVLGRPIPGWKVLLLDRQLTPVAPGIPGEIHVGGAGLALGYLGRVELTAARFVPDPFGGEPGGRLYRSGDLARFRPDGDLEYLGRIDDQVKIRGFRIEPGEIEAVLASHPAVREAAVIARGQGGDQRLVAYVAATEPRPSPGELRELVRQRQPDHMVPAVFVLLDRLPLTPNGKVDRRALPEPEADQDAAFTAPRTPFEEALALIWADLLGVAQVGTDSNFFDLGGDSIQAVRLVSRMNEELGLNFRVQDLFQHQTIAALTAQSAAFAGRISVEQERAAGLSRIGSFCKALLADPQQRASLPDGYEDFFPLSGIEKGMAYYSLLLPEEPVYHDQFVYLLRIPDAGVFFEALALTMERHPVFRTSYDLYAFAEPIKVVHRELRLEREIDDLTDLAEPEQHRRVEEYRASDLGRRFTFEGETIWRFKLFRLRGDLHCAILSFHHAMLDGWSCASLWVEVNNLCARPERMTPLPPLASSYKDFLAITLGREGAPKTAAFWRETLGGVGRNKLPFNRTRNPGIEARGMRTIRRRLGGGLLAALRSVALAHHVPLRTLTLAAHVWLLHVIAAEDEVVTGVVTNERPEIKDGDKILGCFLNTIPVRIDAAGAAGFLPLLRAVDGYLRRAKEHEILLGDIAAAVGNRETADNPFFDTIFNFLDFHILETAEPHAMSETSQAERTAEKYDLEAREMTNTLFDLEVITTLGDLAVKLKYSPRYFDAADAWRAVDLYVRILERIAGDSVARLDPESLLSAAERSEIVDRFNDTRVDYPRETPVFRLIEKQAEELPDHPAVSCGGASLTYGELNRAANRLARHLLRQGARPGDSIGVIHPRSVDLTVALTAVLKMGGAYVPIEPDYPPARKGYIVRNSGVTRIVADRSYEIAEGTAAFVIPGPAEPLDTADSNLDIDPRPDQLAYTIYTSGSTGLPKGVMIEHHSAVNLVQWVNRELAVGPQATLLMLSSVCFDLSVYDLFGGLSAGARVVLAREEDLQDPARLQRLMTEERITFWSSVPSTMGLLTRFLEEVDPGYRQEDLTVVFLSGDWIPLSLPEKIRTFFPSARVISLGGATEGTVWSIFYPVDRVDEAWASIPYGRPIDNNTFYILDRSLSVVPPGVVGDLYIGGVGVAKGYANDPEKTAASFLPDRFAADPGVRMYRTGDLGRMLPDGNIEFLGRADHQVKIRGFRVELGEVESQLLKHPSVREAVVIDKVDSSGEKYLCAYVVAAELPATPELKAYLASTLPEYMIPVAFVSLPALPLTGNGKLDRRALPDPEVANLSTSARYVEPTGEIEVTLAEIWQEVLRIDGIGTRHDFFELGGHSLLAVQVITRIRRRLGVELPLRVLFDTPTVSGLATHIEALRSADAVPERKALGRADRNGPVPLSFAQQRLWFMDQLDPGRSVYNIPAAMTLTGQLGVAALEAALGEVVLRHEVLRTTFGTLAGQPVQIIAPGASVALPVIDLQGLPAAIRGQEAERLFEAEARRPFDLRRGPLLRSALLRFGAEHHVILLTMHHIVSDGWSRGVLVRELSALYEAFLEGRPSPLPALPVQYADFSVWQRELLQGETLEEQLTYWTRHLDGAPLFLALPYDRPRPSQPSFRGGAFRLGIPPEVTAPLKALGRREGTTLFMTLLAAWSILLHRYSGESDIVIGSNIANRHQLNLEGLIGLFANTVALRVTLTEEPTVRELLAQVRDVVLGAQAHQDFPFEKLVEALRPDRAPAYHPIFQVALVMQDAPPRSSAVSRPDPSPVRIERQSAKYDLTLFVTEEADEMTAALEYNADLFEEDTIADLASQLAALLDALPAAVQQPISAVRLISAAEEASLFGVFSEDLEL